MAVVLFLDEVDRATLEVRQGIFELCDSRKLAGHNLHAETLIFAAVNGGTHAGAASYQVGEMDPAELDRYTVFDVEPSIDDWIGMGRWITVMLSLPTSFGTTPSILEHNDDPEPNKVYPSRRSWARFSETVSAACLSGSRTIEPGCVCAGFCLSRIRGCGFLQRLRCELQQGCYYLGCPRQGQDD